MAKDDRSATTALGRQRRTSAAGLTPRALWRRIRAAALAEHGTIRAARGARDGDDAVLSTGISMLTKAAVLTPDHHRARAARISNLGTALHDRYVRLGDRVDLEEAVVAHRWAAQNSALSPDHPTMLSNLSSALMTRYTVTGSRPDIEEADRAALAAVRTCPANHLQRAEVHSNRAAVLLERFIMDGTRQHLVEAIAVMRRGLGDGDGDGDAGPIIRSNLGSALHTLFEVDGEPALIDEVIEWHRSAISDAASSARLAECLADLGSALRARYVLSGQVVDLRSAVTAHRDALSATSRTALSYPKRLGSLAAALATLHDRTGAIENLDEAIALLRDAVSSTPEGHTDRPAHLRNLGVALSTRGALGAGLVDVEDAVEALLRARAATEPNAATWLGITASLGHALSDRYDLTRDPDDLDAALTMHSAAKGAIDATHPDRARIMTDYADTLLARYELHATETDLTSAVRAYEDAATAASSPPLDRARASYRLGDAATLAGEDTPAAQAYSAAVDLFRMVVPGWYAVSDAQHLLSDMSGAASAAAAAFLNLGDLTKALAVLEDGREVLVGYALDRRVDVGDLRAVDERIADRFVAVSDAMNRPSYDDDAVPLTGEQRRAMAAEYDATVAAIRGISGFETFAAAPDLMSILRSLPAAPVVTINVADTRCDALIIDRGHLEALPLDDLSLADAERQALRFLQAVDRHDDYTAVSVLEWLWDIVVDPVVRHLGWTETFAEDAEPPRIYWCPTGPLTVLPFHAAGHHRNPDDAALGITRDRTLIDRAVSSRTSTLRALALAHQTAEVSASLGSDAKALVVAMSRTPNHPDLSRVGADVETLRTVTRGAIDAFGPGLRQAATHTRVLASLASPPWAHFSCHGRADPTNPSRSYLLLEDHETSPLQVSDLMRIDLQPRELAFLAACTTARTGPRVLDESIHMAAAFSSAGFRHVVATLWQISDETASRAAAVFYQHLIGIAADDPVNWSAARAARALHAACLDARNAHPGRPSLWAAYAHWGP